MIGITCSFHDVNNYINLPIKYIQILFMTREDGPITVPITEIIQLKNKLTKRDIIPYVHIDLNIAIYHSYRIRTQNRLKWLFKYAEALGAKACIIHCGSLWNKGKPPKPTDIPIRKEIFKQRLQKIVEITNQKILIENSASKKCFGTTLNELLEYIKNYSNIGICLDTAHAYFAGIDLVQFNRDLHHPKVELIHLNGIHPELKYGSGTDRHGTILNTPKWDETNNLYKETINTAIKSKKPKVLETPFENFKKEIEMCQQLNRNNKSYMEIVNNNQYSQDNYISTNQNNKDALWLAPITVNGIGVYALIDSGAQRTIMTQKLLRELQAKGARFKEYHENGNLMQTDSPLKIVTSIIANVQIGPITNQVKIPVTEKGYIQMIIGIPQLQNCIIDIPKKQITCKGKIISLKSIYDLPTVINNITKEQMHTLLQDYYDGELKRDAFVRTEDYKQLSNKEKKEWLDDELNSYQQWLQRAYKRQRENPVSEVFIEKLWQTKKKAMKTRREPIQGYQLPDGSTMTEKENFTGWIRQIFDAPLQIRTGKYPWENKALPDLPKQERESIHQYIPETTQPMISTPSTNEWIQDYSSQNKFNTLKDEYLFVKGASFDELKQIYPKMDRKEILKEIEIEAKLKGIILKQRSRSRSKQRYSRSRSRSRSRSKQRYSRSRSTGPHGQLIGSPYSSQTSRQYSRSPSSFRTPSRSPSRNTNDPPSLSQSRQQTPISRQSSVNSRSTTPSYAQSARSDDIISRIPTPSNSTSRSRSSSSSSRGPQLTPSWIANSGVVINGDINGYRLQIIFSTIHKTDWLTRETARKCGLLGQSMGRDHYLENTYMDHKYNQRTRNPVDILIGQNNGNNVYITTSDIVSIVNDDEFWNRSESLRDPRNRNYILIGMDTIQHNNLQIRADKGRILMPNPNYQQAVGKKYYLIKTMQYPDLSDQRNREFNIQNIISVNSD